MKKSVAWFGLMSIALLSAGCEQSVAVQPAVNAVDKRVALTTPEDETFYAMGYASSGKFSKMGLTEAEIQAALQGLRDGLSREKPAVDIMSMQEQVDRVTGLRLRAFDEKLAKEGEQFYDDFIKLDGVVVTDSGLAYRIVEPGTGKSIGSASDHVEVYYSGKLHNGTVFDSSVEDGRPARFKLGTTLKGWREGLALISEGGKVTMVLPPKLAYGTHGRAPLVPPNGTLQFDVQLVTVMDEATAIAMAAAERKPMGHGRSFHGSIKANDQVPPNH